MPVAAAQQILHGVFRCGMAVGGSMTSLYVCDHVNAACRRRRQSRLHRPICSGKTRGTELNVGKAAQRHCWFAAVLGITYHKRYYGTSLRSTSFLSPSVAESPLASLFGFVFTYAPQFLSSWAGDLPSVCRSRVTHRLQSLRAPPPKAHRGALDHGCKPGFSSGGFSLGPSDSLWRAQRRRARAMKKWSAFNQRGENIGVSARTAAALDDWGEDTICVTFSVDWRFHIFVEPIKRDVPIARLA
jgi:hypothetical protein